MNWTEYTMILSDLELTKSWAGRTFAHGPVTRPALWASGSQTPESVIILLRVMHAGKITKADVEAAKRTPAVLRYPRSP